MIDKKLDDEVLEITIKENGSFNSSRLKSSYFKNNYSELYFYLDQRFIDLSIDENLREIIIRIKENLEKSPLCPICGKEVTFDGRKYPVFCSKECLKSKNGKIYINNKKAKTNLEKYGVECSFQNDEIKKKSKNKCLENFGVDHPMKCKEIKEKALQTFLHKSDSEKNEIKNKVKKTKKERYGNENFVNSEKAKITNIVRYGVDNPMKCEEIKEKAKKTCLEKYGVEKPIILEEFKEKREKTCLEKYGVKHITQSDVQKQKSRETFKKKYGVEYTFQNKEFIEKSKQTRLLLYGNENFVNSEKAKITNCERYGCSSPMKCKEIKEKVKKKFLDRYGVENPMFLEENKEKCRKTNIDRYGVENPMQNTQINEKQWETKRKNNTLTTSTPEEKFQEYLIKKEIKFKRNYNKDPRYPYHADFYIVDYDLFLEIQGLWTHGGHPFNEQNENDLDILKKWKEHDSKYYKNSIEVWTVKDVEKRNLAKKNKINFLEIFSIDINVIINEFEKYLNNHD